MDKIVEWVRENCRFAAKKRICACIVVLRLDSEGKLETLIGRRRSSPYSGQWAIPGGHVNDKESAEQGARRELKEETRLTPKELVKIGEEERDGAKHVVFAALVDDSTSASAGSDLSEVKWVSADKVPHLAFNDNEYVRKALSRFKSREKTAAVRKFAASMVAYHASATGPNNEFLQSFRANGATTDKSIGMAAEQGAGLYMWPDLERAKHFATFVTATQWGKDTKDGWPMVLSFKINPNPKDFRVDYELATETTANVLKALTPLIRELGNSPEDERQDWQKQDPERPAYMNQWEKFKNFHEQGGYFLVGNGKGPVFDHKTKKRVPGEQYRTFYDSNTKNVNQAAAVKELLAEVQKRWPGEYAKAVRPFAKNPDRTNSAFVYIGQEPLHPFNIMALVMGKWIDVTAKDPITMDQFHQEYEREPALDDEFDYGGNEDGEREQLPIWYRPAETPSTSLEGYKWRRRQPKPQAPRQPLLPDNPNIPF